MLGEGDQVTTGAPFVAGASVTAEVLRAKRGPKIIVFKKKRRKNHRRRNGHRQDLTELRIGEILTVGEKPKAEPAPKPAPKPAEEEAPAVEPEELAAAEAAPAPEASAPEVVATAPQTLEAPEGEADDLKQIGGVGPQLEKKLNGLGIFHFRQIAALSPEE
ncbi:MAG: 50S ribosomal protein L21, partial [candidate division NC10 bacterium]